MINQCEWKPEELCREFPAYMSTAWQPQGQGHTAKAKVKVFGSRPRPDNHKAKATNFGFKAKD